MSITKAACATCYGPIQVISPDGEFLPEERVIRLEETSATNSIAKNGLSLIVRGPSACYGRSCLFWVCPLGFSLVP